jgi:hypothetical protein
MTQRFPDHLLDRQGRPVWGTPQMAAFLRTLWVPEDFPCRDWGFDMVDGRCVCRTCGVDLMVRGDTVVHPGTPAAEQRERD